MKTTAYCPHCKRDTDHEVLSYKTSDGYYQDPRYKDLYESLYHCQACKCMHFAIAKEAA